MNHLSIDIETKSSVDITKAGAYKYAQSDDFKVLLFAYKMDDAPVVLIDLTQEESLPQWLIDALDDPKVVKHAYNAAFEWYCLNRAGYLTPIDQWRCTMAHGLYCGYTAGLDATGKAMGIPSDKRKLTTGKALIRYFCTPCTPTKANGGRTWNLPKHAPDKWNLFKDYCRQDVVTEREILDRLEAFPMPEEEEKLWQMDVMMNAYGVKADRILVEGALRINERSNENLKREAVELTGLTNPNSTAQLLPWLGEHGLELDNLQKATVSEILESDAADAKAQRVLEIRQQMGKTSVKKYTAMYAAMGENCSPHARG